MLENDVRNVILELLQRPKKGYSLYIDVKNVYKSLDPISYIWIINDLKNEGEIISYLDEDRKIVLIRNKGTKN